MFCFLFQSNLDEPNKTLLNGIVLVFSCAMSTPIGSWVVSGSGVLDGVFRRIPDESRPRLLLHLAVTEAGAEVVRDLGFVEHQLEAIQVITCRNTQFKKD